MPNTINNMTIITVEDDYQVVTIKSKSKASTLDEFVKMCAGIAVALGYDPDYVAEKMLDERGGEVSWLAAGFKPGEIIKGEEITLPPRNSGFGGGHVSSTPDPDELPSSLDILVGTYK